MKTLTFLLVLCALVATTVSVAVAAREYWVNTGVVEKVDGDMVVVTVVKHAPMVYTVAKTTTFSKNTQPIAVTDLTPGDVVTVRHHWVKGRRVATQITAVAHK